MFRDQILRYGLHVEGISKIPAYDLRDVTVQAEVQELALRISNGDWTAVDRLGLLHMRVCALMASKIAAKYQQDCQDMVGWANVGIVDACANIAAHAITLKNVTGYIITRAKSMCLNNLVDQETGFSRDDMRQLLLKGIVKPAREELTDTIPAKDISDPLIQVEFLDALMPRLSEHEFDLFCLLLRCYTDEEAGDELNIRKSRVYSLKSGIQLKADSLLREIYGPRCRFKK